MTKHPAGRVLWHVTMSLDGFIAGPDHAMEWLTEIPFEPSPVVDEVIVGTGAILAGRHWYDVATRRYGGSAGIYGGAWQGPVLVLTHHPPVVWEDPAVTFVSEGRDVGLLGADIARQCLEKGLVDELLVHLTPVLLGDGVRLFDRAGGEAVRMEAVELSCAGPILNAWYRVPCGQ